MDPVVERSMDLVVELMKNTYLLRPEAVEKDMDLIWKRYQHLLDNSKTIEELWEARVYLYMIGYLYPEKFGLEAIERRLKFLREPLTLKDFLYAIDTRNIGKEWKSDPLFMKLERLYSAIKKYKQMVKNNSYLDEDRFNSKQKELIGDKSELEIALGF
jgi:hypothetical protein